jgi:hypothetical protein
LDTEGADYRMIKADENKMEGLTRWVKYNPNINPMLSGPYPNNPRQILFVGLKK